MATTETVEWAAAPWIRRPDRVKAAAAFASAARVQIETTPVIEATNVYWLHFLDPQKDEWKLTDFPNCAPPFPRFFIEADRPPFIYIDGHREDCSFLPERVGVLFEASDCEGKEERLSGAGILADTPGARWRLSATLFYAQSARPGITGYTRSFFVDERGSLLEQSNLLTLADADAVGPHPNLLCGITLVPSLLALSFMNCKNVSLDVQQPDRAINRERQKAGLKPFVRYHTINIDPMKSVLRTEGGIETNGLKKALHICRGHFKTFTTSFMGRPLNEPLTLWSPAHVRGSAKEGIVVSDYQVNTPRHPT